MKSEIKKTYHDNGAIQSEIMYDNKQRRCMSRIYNSDGDIMYMIPYQNGQKHGIEKQFYITYSIKHIPHYNGQRQGIKIKLIY